MESERVHLAWTGTSYQESVFSEGRWWEGHQLDVPSATDYEEMAGVQIEGGPLRDGSEARPKVLAGSQLDQSMLAQEEPQQTHLTWTGQSYRLAVYSDGLWEEGGPSVRQTLPSTSEDGVLLIPVCCGYLVGL